MPDDSAPSADPNDDPVTIVSTQASTARVYDYLMGGDDNFAVDRDIADRVATQIGGMDKAMVGLRAQRAFLDDTFRRLAGELEVRQFLDIGVGIPTAENVPAVAQQVAPEARIVYVDNDPLVLAHAHSLQRSTPEGATAYVNADLRDPTTILKQAAATLDFGEPVAIVLVAILHLFEDDEGPQDIVAELVEAMQSQSYLVISHAAADIQGEEMARLAAHIRQTTPGSLVLRTNAEVARFFEGMEMLEPGLVPLDQWHQWRRGEPTEPDPASSTAWRPPYHVGVGRKP
ncbi:MAG: SAM-dependent methyltransferase [Acidimicrobiales bacterium]